MGVLSVPFRSNRTLQRLEDAGRVAAKAQEEQEPLTALSGHIARFWQAAQTAKFPIERQMLRALRQRQGVYEPEDLALIKESGGSEIFMMLTSAKCRAAESWLREILLPDSDRPWGLEPTPMPDLPPPVQAAIVGAITQEALAAGWEINDARIDERLLKVKSLAFKRMKDLSEKIAERHELKIADQLEEGGWEQALSDAIYDLVTFPAAIIKGPFLRSRLQRSWIPGPNGVWLTRVTRTLHLEYERRSPFDIFPAPAMRDMQRGNLIDRYRFTREDIQSLRGVPGYSDTALDQVLEDYGERGYSSRQMNDLERARLELRPNESYDPEGMIEGLNFWGSMPGRKLMEWQYHYKMDLGIKLDPYREYQIEAWKIGRYVIKAFPNPDPLGEKPYDKASFEEIPGAFWGLGVPDVGIDCQRMCNAAARAIANNAAIACLTADTVVYREGQHRGTSPITIAELWRRKQASSSALRRTKLRSLDEATGEFVSNRLVDVIDNGIADVFELVTEKGYRIRATGNHRFMRDDGEWQVLDDFDDGDLVAVNGQVVPLQNRCIDCGAQTAGRGARCASCGAKRRYSGLAPKACVECGAATARRGVRCRSCASKLENSAWNQKQVVEARGNASANATTARGRYECQSKKKDFCESCGVREVEGDVRLEVHHKDRAPWNKEDSNLQTLCASCHHALHAREDSLGDPYLHRYLSFDRIVSITHVGREQVYDLQMEGPNHNFVGNGLINHNSGPQVEQNVDRLAQGETVSKPYPWKVYQTTTDMTGNNQPAVRFWQAQMNVQELLAIYQHFDGVFDNVTGFPKYSYGDSRVGGAGRTSSGLAQLLGNVGKGVRRVVAACDRGLIRPKVRRTYEFNMEFDPDPTIKFDLRAVAKGSAAVLIKEQTAMRQKEMLQATLNPMDMQIIGPKGRAEMLRPALKAADFNADDILPDTLEMQLIAATMPPAHQILGKTGPNGPASPGMGGSGGTPEGPANLDNAGNPVQGTDVRQQQLGYKDGGIVRRPPYSGYESAGHSSDFHFHLGREKRKVRMSHNADGSTTVEELDGDDSV